MSNHVWRRPREGEPQEEGGVCVNCGRYASAADEPCNNMVDAAFFARLQVPAIRCLLDEMTGDERLEFFEEITDGYCQGCGSMEPEGSYCQCQNDE